MITLFKKASISCTVVALMLTFLVGCTSVSSPSSKNSHSPQINKNTQAPKAKSDTTQNDAVSESSSSTKSTNSNNSNSQQDNSVKLLLSDIKKLAEEGKIINSKFPLKSVIEDVTAEWGEPDKSEWIAAASGNYYTFSKYNVVYGVNKGEQIFEVRSFDKQLSTIHLSTLKSFFGKPDYDNKMNGQEIIGYVVNKEYKLLFVFPSKAGMNNDPTLDHYSVFYPRGTVNNMADYPGRKW